jgi:hypothetical protein
LGAINGSGVQENEKRQVVVKNVALFTDVHFVRDISFLKTYYSVSTDKMKQELVHRGFEEIKVDHITDNLALPMAPDAPTGTTTRAATSLGDQTPPMQLKLPPDGAKHFVPRLYREEGETYAAAILRAYEEKAVDKQENTVYSPIRRWSTSELLHRGLRGNSKLTLRRKAYWTLRKMGIPPEENSLQQLVILAKAKEYLQSKSIEYVDWETLAFAEYSKR